MEFRKNGDGSVAKIENMSTEEAKKHLYRQKVLLDRRKKEVEELEKEVENLERAVEVEG